jgi:hypothetical protein
MYQAIGPTGPDRAGLIASDFFVTWKTRQKQKKIPKHEYRV